MKEIIERLKEELTIEELQQMARDVNSYDGSLDYLDYYENDEYFFKEMFGDKVDEAVRAVCYGDYNYTDDYVRFNAYGNLDSCNQWDYEKDIEDSAEEILENYIELIDKMWDDQLNRKIKDIMEEEENEETN